MHSKDAAAVVPSDSQEERGAWRAVLGLALCVSVLMGVSIYSFIIFFSSLAAEAGWSATQMGGVVSAMWLTAPLALISASLMSRVGAWRLVGFGVLAQAGSLLALPHIHGFPTLYALRMLMGVGKIVTMTSVPVLVAEYFERRFSAVMSMIWASGVGGGLVIGPLSEKLVTELGWRSGATALGLIVIVVLAIAWALVRSAPPPKPAAPEDFERFSHRPGTAWRELLRALGPVQAVVCFVAVIGGGMVSIAAHSHQIRYFEKAGLDPTFSAYSIALLSGGAMLGSLGVGWLLSRFSPLVGAIATSLFLYVGLALYRLLPYVPQQTIAAVATVCVGFTLGGGEALWISLLRLSVPKAVFSTAYGGWYFSLQAGYAAGGAVGGFVLDHFGSDGFVAALALMYLPAALMTLKLSGVGASATLRQQA